MLSAGQVMKPPVAADPHKSTGRCRDCCGFLLASNPGSLPFTTLFQEAKANRTGLVPGVVCLVTVGTMVDKILFCLILNQALLCFVGSAAKPTFNDVCTGGLMVTKTVAAVTPQWFEHPGAEVENLPAAQGQLG